MAILPSTTQQDRHIAFAHGLPPEQRLSSHTQALLAYLQGLPKGKKVCVRALMLDSADNPSYMHATLKALKTYPGMVFDAMGHVFFDHDRVSTLVVNAPVVEDRLKQNAHRVVAQRHKDDGETVKSQQLNDWLASRATNHGMSSRAVGDR